MQTFTVSLNALCHDEIGMFLWAFTPNKALFLAPPMARFSSLSDLQEACIGAGVACSDYSGPDSAKVQELTAEQLHGLGFKLQRPLPKLTPLVAPPLAA